MEDFNKLKSQLEGKRVLYITTKNQDYIRVTQEINLLKEIAGSVEVIGSFSKSYPKRLIHVYSALLKHSMKNIDVAFVGFSPQLVMPFFHRKLNRVTVVIDFFISMYDTIISDRKLFKDGGFVSRVCHRNDEKTLARADYIVCDTKAHGDFFAKEFGAAESKLHVLYLQADASIYSPRETQKNNTGKNKVLYFGSILNLQGVDVILDAIRLLKDEPNLEFEIIGPIPERMDKPLTDNVTYIDWLSQQDLAEHIAAAGLCLAGHFSGDIMKAKRTIPGKAYIYEAMKRPMILGDGPANHELFQEDTNHIFVKMGDAKALADKIKNYFN